MKNVIIMTLLLVSFSCFSSEIKTTLAVKTVELTGTLLNKLFQFGPAQLTTANGLIVIGTIKNTLFSGTSFFVSERNNDLSFIVEFPRNVLNTIIRFPDAFLGNHPYVSTATVGGLAALLVWRYNSMHTTIQPLSDSDTNNLSRLNETGNTVHRQYQAVSNTQHLGEIVDVPNNLLEEPVETQEEICISDHASTTTNNYSHPDDNSYKKTRDETEEQSIDEASLLIVNSSATQSEIYKEIHSDTQQQDLDKALDIENNDLFETQTKREHQEDNNFIQDSIATQDDTSTTTNSTSHSDDSYEAHEANNDEDVEVEDAFSSMITSSKQEIEELKKTYEETQQNITTMNTNLSSRNSVLQDQSQSIDDSIKNLEDQKQERETTLNKLIATQDSVEVSNNSIRDGVQQTSRAIDDLSKTAQQQKSDIQKMGEGITNLEEKVKDVEQSTRDAQDRSERITRKLEELIGRNRQ